MGECSDKVIMLLRGLLTDAWYSRFSKIEFLLFNVVFQKFSNYLSLAESEQELSVLCCAEVCADAL